MTDICIVVKENNGGCSIIMPTNEALEKIGLDAIIQKDIPSGKPYRIIDKSLLPQDREFRNAWTDDLPTETIDVDMNKARAHVREVRNQGLLELDKKIFSEARKPKNKILLLEQLAQELRDIPQDEKFLSENLDDLKSLLLKARKLDV